MNPEQIDDSNARASDGPLAVRMLELMCLIRAFDSNLPTLYNRGLIQGSSHSAIGQEAVAVGACLALDKNDYVTSTHRGHGHAIAKGCDLVGMTAELLGRSTGICRGKGGSMHIADFSINMLGANGVVGASFGIAAGAAMSVKQRNGSEVVLCFFGEGALNQGSFMECANMAKIWSLPVIFLCENNHYAMSAQPEQMLGVKSLTDRAFGAGIDGVEVDGMNVRAVYEAVGKAVTAARSGSGPQFIAADCYRYEGHFSGDTMAYRDSLEIKLWEDRDPIKQHIDSLLSEGLITREDITLLERRAADQVNAALEIAVAAPFPDPSEAWEDLYA